MKWKDPISRGKICESVLTFPQIIVLGGIDDKNAQCPC